MGSTSLTAPASPLFESAVPRRRPARASSRAASRVVALDGTGHAARATPAAHELGPLETDDGAFVVGDAHVAGEEVHRGHDTKAGPFHLPERADVASIREDETGAHCHEVARRRPLLALLNDAALAPAEDRRQRHPAIGERREDVGLLPQRRLPLVPVQHAQTLGADEVRWKADAQLMID